MAVAPEKRRFTADEFLGMAETGILCEDDRLELIDGEVVEMTPVASPSHCVCFRRPRRRGRVPDGRSRTGARRLDIELSDRLSCFE
jgi:hypothetical protein